MNTMQKIPRPMNCFLLYRHDKQKEILTKCPGANHRDISKIIAKWWKEATIQEKAPYVERARKAKVEHSRLYPNYKYMPQKKSKGKPRTYKRKTQNEFTSKSEERNNFMKLIYQNRDALSNCQKQHQHQINQPSLSLSSSSCSSSLLSPSSSPISASMLNLPSTSSSSSYLLSTVFMPDSFNNSTSEKYRKNKKNDIIINNNGNLYNKMNTPSLSFSQYPSPIHRSPSPLQQVCNQPSGSPLSYNNTMYESNSNTPTQHYSTFNPNPINNDTNVYNDSMLAAGTATTTTTTTTFSDDHYHQHQQFIHHRHYNNTTNDYMNESQLDVNDYYFDHNCNFFNIPITAATAQFNYSMATPPPTFTNYVYTTDNNSNYHHYHHHHALLNSSIEFQEIALDLPIYPNDHYLF